jgi:hypothetical protein
VHAELPANLDAKSEPRPEILPSRLIRHALRDRLLSHHTRCGINYVVDPKQDATGAAALPPPEPGAGASDGLDGL